MMDVNVDAKSKRLQVSVRGLLLLTSVVAVAVFALIKWYAWYTAYPWHEVGQEVTLQRQIDDFNGHAAQDPLGRLEPPLTEREVVDAILSQLPTLKSRTSKVGEILPGYDRRVYEAFDRIAKTHRLPNDATLDFMSSYSNKKMESREVWWVNLSISLSDELGYSMRIRENNAPHNNAAKESPDPKD